MKKFACLFFASLLAGFSFAQETKQKIERACLDYIEGFYEGDTSKLIQSLKPSLYKFGYWKNKNSGVYEADEHNARAEGVGSGAPLLLDGVETGQDGRSVSSQEAIRPTREGSPTRK